MSTPTKAAAAEAAAQVADGFDRQIRAELAAGVNAGRSVPKLLGLIANDDKGAAMYARWTGRACQRNGVEFELRKVERVNLEDAVIAANDDASVHGIIVYYPVFGGAIDDYIRDVISASKDVEGLNHRYRYALYHNIRYLDDGGLPDYLDERAAGAAPRRKKCIVPCTPLACIKILEHLSAYDESQPVGERLVGKTALVYNRSEVVGRPLAAMLANDGALVYSVDITGILVYRRGRVKGTLKVEETSVTPEKALTEADIVISGVPSPSFKVDTSRVKKSAIAINFSGTQNFADGTEDKCAFVPAIGKVTIAMLQRNLLRLYADGGPGAGARPVARAAALGRRLLSAPLVAGGVVLLALVAGRYAMR